MSWLGRVTTLTSTTGCSLVLSIGFVMATLEQNQKTITETTGLLKRLHELSIAIAEKQQDQLDATRCSRRVASGNGAPTRCGRQVAGGDGADVATAHRIPNCRRRSAISASRIPDRYRPAPANLGGIARKIPARLTWGRAHNALRGKAIRRQQQQCNARSDHRD